MKKKRGAYYTILCPTVLSKPSCTNNGIIAHAKA